MKGPIQSMEVSYLVHSTEDREKIALAASGAFGTASRGEAEALEGHFGNEIVMVRIHLNGTEAESAAKSMFASMSPGLYKRVRADLESHLDEHSALFLRFDKQELVRGRIALGSADPVRVKVKLRLFMVKGRAPEFYRTLMDGGRRG